MNKEMKTQLKRFGEQWGEQLNGVKNELDNRIDELNEGIQEVTRRNMGLETRTTELEVKVDQQSQVVNQSSEEITHIKEKLNGEVNRLQYEIRHRPATMCMYDPRPDDRNRIVFEGKRKDNPIEFIRNCEREMEKIGTPLTDPENIDFVTRHFKNSASQWYTIVRDNITTYAQFTESFENRYWNVHTQR